MTKEEYVKTITPAMIKEFLCSHFKVSLEYSDLQVDLNNPFTDCELVNEDFAELTMRHSFAETQSMKMKRNSMNKHAIIFTPSATLNNLKVSQ